MTIEDPAFQTRAELEWWVRCQVAEFMKLAPHSNNQVRMMLSIADRIRRVMVAHLHLPFPPLPHIERPDDELAMQFRQAALLEGAQIERARVVGWLKGLHWTALNKQAAEMFADAIEHGAHDAPPITPAPTQPLQPAS